MAQTALVRDDNAGQLVLGDTFETALQLGLHHARSV
jgi:hypothetical protein